jgi:hypothetical protein
MDWEGQADGESAVEPPGLTLGAGQLGDHWPPGHFEAVAHAGQQPVELVIAQLDRARPELADTRLADAAEVDRADWVVRVSRITSRCAALDFASFPRFRAFGADRR